MAKKAKASKKPKPSQPELKPPSTGGGTIISGTGGGGKVPSGSGYGGGGSPPKPDLPSDIPPPPSAYDYYPDQLTLYGIKLNPEEDMPALSFGDNKVLRLDVYDAEHMTDPLTPRMVSFAVAYGYAYEGHCYRFDKPRMFVIEDSGMGAVGCGFAPPYVMWNIPARTNLLEISLNHDLAETLVLEANFPGNRPPNTYRNDMKLAHRGGKLNRPGDA